MLSRQISSEQDDKHTAKNEIQIKWANIILIIYLHCAAFYGLILSKSWGSVLFMWIYGILSAFGITVASHRYYSHKSFKANKKLRFILLTLQTMVAQEPVYNWVRDHRIHHKYTNADPYSAKRGFFFSHVGWLMCKKHPDVMKQGSKVDMSDLDNDEMVQFQRKHYRSIALLTSFVFPICVYCYIFGETFSVAWHTNMIRYVAQLNLTWGINSFAHFLGDKPYDKNISPIDSRSFASVSLGEGWHNYHHVFPWDYNGSEFPGKVLNLSAVFIEFFAWLGWATELKTVSKTLVHKRVLRTGDGSHPYAKEMAKNKKSIEYHDDELKDNEHFWGFGDKEMTQDDLNFIEVLPRTGTLKLTKLVY